MLVAAVEELTVAEPPERVVVEGLLLDKLTELCLQTQQQILEVVVVGKVVQWGPVVLALTAVLEL